MKKQRFLKYFLLLLSTVFAVALIASLRFGVRETASAPETEHLTGTDGNPIVAVSISDLAELARLERANYTPNEYLIPQNEARGTAVTLGKERAAGKGTYQFVFLNLDPADPDFEQKSAALAPYLKGDNYWHFTLYLPKIWSSAVVYARSVPVGFTGSISDYDFTEYSDYKDKTEFHRTATEPRFVDVKFYARRRGIPEDPLTAATVVTIHYESEGDGLAGLSEVPLVGSDEAVRTAVAQNKSAPTVLAAIAALTLAVFVFLCFLKRTLSFLPQLLIALGVFGTLGSAIALLGATAAPRVWLAVGNFSFAFLSLSAILCLRVKVGKFPIWILWTALASIDCVAAFLAPFLPASALAGYGIYRIAAAAVLSAAIFLSAAVAARGEKTDAAMLVNPLLAGFAALAALFPPLSAAIAHPVYWLFASILAVTLVVSFRVFVRTEKRNRSLTANLRGEVARQTADLQAAVTERDDLLRHVSHDTKSPISGIEQFLSVLRRREKDEEQLKALNILSQKTEELKRTLRDLGAYSKLNFVVETSEAFDAGDTLKAAYENLEPDCSASGIVLRCAPVSIFVFGKKNALISVLNNLILNAVEHSGCKTIGLSAFKRKTDCVITVTDDGRGIAPGPDVFEPYRRETDSDTNEGLGLYLCKSMMKSMDGDISYTQSDGKLTFAVTLPLA